MECCRLFDAEDRSETGLCTHLYRSFVFVHQAEYFRTLPEAKRHDISSESAGQWDRGRYREQNIYDKVEVDGKKSSCDAALDLFYAGQVDVSYDIPSHLDAEDRDTYHKIQRLENIAVVEKELPLVGTWRGDPLLWSSWRWDQRLLMQLFRQRHRAEFDDLAAQYTSEGITWEYYDNGQLVVNDDIGAWEALKRD